MLGFQAMLRRATDVSRGLQSQGEIKHLTGLAYVSEWMVGCESRLMLEGMGPTFEGKEKMSQRPGFIFFFKG